MLSHDSQESALKAIDQQIEFAKAIGSARALASVMMNHDHNPDPHPERNAPSPAYGVRIRRFVPMVAVDYRVEVSEECKRHNDAVSNLRKP